MSAQGDKKMAWNYEGYEIEPTLSGKFRAVFEGVNIIKSSLDAVKKDIDKRQSTKALATPLSLPVVILREKGLFDELVMKIDHCIISGIDPETREVQGVEETDWKNSEILPDSPANTKRLEALMAARDALHRAEKAIKGREVSLWIPRGPRNVPIPYAAAVQKLTENYEKAKIGEGE